MEPITLLIAGCGSLAVCLSKPIRGLIIYFAVLCLYPQYLTLKLGELDFNTSRIVIIVLLARILLKTDLVRRFRWTWLDTFVVLTFVGQCLALSSTTAFITFAERQSGVLVNMVLPYFAVRLVVTSREELLTFVKGLVTLALPLVAVGTLQCVSGYNVYSFMRTYDAWESSAQPFFMRRGFYRADGPFGNSIPFGLFFAGLVPICLISLSQRIWTPATTIGLCGLLMVGLLSSMSSGPVFSIAVSVAVLSFYPFRKFKPLLVGVLLATALFLELYSDRHFYEVPSRLTYSSANAYDRIRGYEEAFGGGMTGHWLTGYGYVGLGPRSDNTDFHWESKALLSIYVSHLARFGLLGLVPFLIVNTLYYVRLYQAARAASTQAYLWVVWCFLATLAGWNVAMLAGPPLAQIIPLHFCFIAVACNLLFIVTGEDNLPELVHQGYDHPAPSPMGAFKEMV